MVGDVKQSIYRFRQAKPEIFLQKYATYDTDLSSKYVPAIAEMKSDELESWYDEVYQMCLLAFLRLEQDERKIEFDELKKRIEQK